MKLPDKYRSLMVLSFVYGGFLLIVYLATAYSLIWDNSIVSLESSNDAPFERWANNSRDNRSGTAPENVSGPNNSLFTLEYPRTPFSRAPRTLDPFAVLSSPFLIFILLGGVLGIVNGLALHSFTRKHEIKKVRTDLHSKYLSNEEKEILDLLGKSSGELTQRNITELTGYSRVKVHRIIHRLEEKNLVQKVPNGQTNRIILQAEDA